MAMRTDAEALKLILDNTQLSTTILEAFIGGANIMVTQILGTTLSDTVLTEIEKWLAGHFVATTRERVGKKEEAGSAKIEYSGIFGAGLGSTSYGQMVLALDTTGEMANANDNASGAAKKPVVWTAVQSFES